MNSTISWPDETLPADIHCAPEVLAGLEMAAVDGLLAMPRVGLGVGGRLLGRREAGRIHVTGWEEISCSHAKGPSFVLTRDELEAALEARPTGSEPGHEVVGCYCSVTSGPLAVTEHGLALFDALCPEPWQVALVMRAKRGFGTIGAFGVRGSGASGSPIVWGEPRELVCRENPASEETLPQVVEAVKPALPDSANLHSNAASVAPPPVSLPLPLVPIEMPRTGTLFGAEEDATPLRRWKGLLATAALLAVLSAAAFLTREYWMPRPRVALMASSDRTARIWVLWNGEALGDVDHGALVIDTGDGPLHTIHLDRAQLRAGVLGYDCQPGRATATLLAGDTGESVTLTVRAEAHLPDSGISK